MSVRATLAAAYDREAAGYEARFAAQQRPKIERLAAMLPPPAPDAAVLDVGAGTGLARALWPDERWFGCRWVGVDLSAGMLRIARARGDLAVRADACALPFRAAVFSRVISVTGLVLPEHVLPALRSMVRVVDGGGWIGLSVREPLFSAVESAVVGLPVARVLIDAFEGERLVTLHRRAR